MKSKKVKKEVYYIPSIICMCFIISILVGCASLEKKRDDAEPEQKSAIEVYEGIIPKDLPGYINTELKTGVTLDGYLDVSKELTEYKLKRTVLTRHLLETESVVEDFLKEQDNLVVKERRNSQKEDESLENGKVIDLYIAELDDGQIQCRDLYFTFCHYEENLFVIANIESDLNSYLDRVPRKTNLPFVSMEKAEQALRNSLSVLGLDNESFLEPQVFTFTADFLQEVADEKYKVASELEFEEEMEWYNLEFSEEDGYYYMRMRQGLQGVPVYYLGGVDETMSGTYWNLPTSVECIYGKAGMTILDITNLFNIREEGEVEIKSFSEMLDKFCSTHGTAETTIKYIGLAYLPIVKDGSKLEFDGQPVWYFVYDEVWEPKRGTSREVIIYNAETGEVMG